MPQPPDSRADWASMRTTSVPGVELLHARFVEHAFEKHSHAEWCIGVTFDGNQSFRCRGEDCTSRRGDVIVFRPDDAHDGHGEDARGFEYAMAYIAEERLDRWLAESGARKPGLLVRGALVHDPDCAAKLARAFSAATQRGESLRAEYLLGESVAELFARHAGHRPRDPAERTVPPWLARVREHLEAHYAQDVKVEDLARIAQVSRIHLTRAFTRAYGAPPHVHLNSLRLRAAKRLIARGVALAEVAAEVGYADQSHFTRRFRGAFGVTPREWQRGLAHSPMGG